MSILGAHVRLEPLRSTDAAFVSELDADPVVRANVVGWGWPQSVDACADRLRLAEESNDVKRWLVLNRETGRPLGVAGLWKLDWRDKTAEIGIKLGGGQTARGRGFGPDTVFTLSAFAFSDIGLRRLYATVLATNTPSMQMFSKHCGWTQEGTLRGHVIKGQEPIDCHIFGLLADEFKAHAKAEQYLAEYPKTSSP